MLEERLKILLLWERRLLVGLIYVLPLWEVPKNLLWVSLTMIYLARVFLLGRRGEGGRVEWAIGFYFFIDIFSSVFAIHPYESLKGVWDFVRAVSLFWIAADHLKRDSEFRFFRHIVFATAIAGVFGAYEFLQGQVKFYKETQSFHPRMRLQLPSIGHPNQSGLYLAMVWCVAMVLALKGKRFGDRWREKGALIVVGLVLLGSTARVAILVAVMLTVGMVWRWGLSKSMFKLFFSLALFTLLVALGPTFVRDKFLSRGSLSTRVEVWKRAWETALERPWYGVGLNNFKYIHLRNSDPQTLSTVDHAHSLYFNTLAQTGFLGLGALLALLTITCSEIYRRLRSAQDLETSLRLKMAGAVWLVVVVVGFSNTTLHHEMAMVFFLLMSVLRSRPGKFNRCC